MNSPKNPKTPGFTLIELLVVIAIIATLTAVGFMVGPKMMARAKATDSIQNIRQIGPILMTYSSENSMTFPAIRGMAPREDGTQVLTQWNEECLAILFPNTDREEFRTQAWWNENKSFIRNPMFKQNAAPRGWTPLNPGYAFNMMIAENLLVNAGKAVPSTEELLEAKVSVAVLNEPNRTPLIAPYDNFYYRYDAAEVASFQRGTPKDLTHEGNVPVLFVDGHLETMRPRDYFTRRLHEAPFDPEDR